MAKGALAGLLETTRLTDSEIRKVTRDAAREADRIIRSLEGVSGPGAQVRSAQIALAKANAEMWGSVGNAVTVGIGDAFDSATQYQALVDSRLMRAAGVTPAYWEQSMLATSREGLPKYLARKQNGMTLSQRVYRNQALSRGYVDRAVNNGLLLGKSAREIAKDVVGFIDPNVSGGASYAAMRLARTEIQNAHHTISKEQYKNTPWVENVRWNLSGSHGEPDECDEYAERDDHNLGAGVMRPHEVPEKPHPNCLCFIEPITIDIDKYVQNFQEGKYDSYIDEQMGCQRSA